MNDATIKRLLNKELWCSVVSLGYDYVGGFGRLDMVDGHCCHMPACIRLFETIDPNVKRIQTFSGNRIDTIYIRRGKEWTAFSPGGVVRNRRFEPLKISELQYHDDE